MPYRRIHDAARLQRLLDSVLLLEADLSVPVFLRHFLEEARALTGARYGALGLLDEEGKYLSEFLTAGLSEEAEHAIGAPPTGRGVLGLLMEERKPLRLKRLADHPAAVGFPPGHPEMRSFLGVPVGVHGKIFGKLYLTEKIGSDEFSDDDEAVVLALAQAVGLALERARLQERVQELAVLEDRDRIARDLHDAVIQRLFAIGLSLQGIARPPLEGEALQRVQQSIDDLDETIRRIRSSIFELSHPSTSSPGLRAGVLALVRELRPVVGFDVAVSFDGPLEAMVPDHVVEDLRATIRESLTNVGRHAQATYASLRVSVRGSDLELEVVDNGRGIRGAASDDDSSGGLGLANLRRRAEKLGGELTVSSPEGGGTSLVWRVPV